MKTRLSERDKQGIAFTREHILLYFHEPQSLGMLCVMTGMNRTKLSQGFKLIYATSIHQFLIETRMKAARQLLKTTDLPVKAVAANCGYANTQNFITAFRKYSQYTPLEYRNSSKASLL